MHGSKDEKKPNQSSNKPTNANKLKKPQFRSQDQHEEEEEEEEKRQTRGKSGNKKNRTNIFKPAFEEDDQDTVSNKSKATDGFRESDKATGGTKDSKKVQNNKRDRNLARSQQNSAKRDKNDSDKQGSRVKHFDGKPNSGSKKGSQMDRQSSQITDTTNLYTFKLPKLDASVYIQFLDQLLFGNDRRAAIM